VTGRALIAVALALSATMPWLAPPADARTVEAPGPVAVTATTTTRVSPAQPRILVRFRTDSTTAQRERAIATVGGTVDRVLDAIGVTRVVLPIPSTEDATGLTALRLARDPAVVRVEPDSSGSVQFTPNDSLYRTDPQFGLGQWGIRTAHVDQAWDLTRGSPAVIVAIIDTGIDANHPDLAGVSLPGTTFITSPDPPCDPASTVDDNGHGTHVAGLIAANGNNGRGIAGVAFGVRILPIKALDCQGSGLLSDVASSVIWATDHGARIINISLGSSSAQSTLQDAIRYAVARNVLVVTAAGNCGVISVRCGYVNEPQYPGAYPETFAVGATDPSDVRASFSNMGSYVALSAPGVRIWSTTPTYPTTLSRNDPGSTNYAALSGTSQAAPFVAGVAALLLSEDPTLTAAQLSDRLRSTADDLGPPGPDPSFGAGRVNALRAVTLSAVPRYDAHYDVSALPAHTSTLDPIDATVTLTNTSNFVWAAAGADPVRLAFHWSDLAGRTIVWDGRRTVLPADVPLGGAVALHVTIPTPAAPGVYRLRLDLVREGVTWFSAAHVATPDIAVVVGNGYAASYAPTPASEAAFRAGARTLDVVVANLGAVTWPAGGITPVRLSYHLIRPDGSILVWEGERAPLPADLAPGGSAHVLIPISAPPVTGGYLVWLDLVQENILWFSSQGVAQGNFAFDVPGITP
jgi:type VII secretion-associated serine protease mycosin